MWIAKIIAKKISLPGKCADAGRTKKNAQSRDWAFSG